MSKDPWIIQDSSQSKRPTRVNTSGMFPEYREQDSVSRVVGVGHRKEGK